MQTIQNCAEEKNLEILSCDAFRERKVDPGWIDDFSAFSQKQWENFQYKLPEGECLQEVQDRCISAVQKILLQHPEQNVIISTHGTALSTIINFYQSTFGYADFQAMVDKMPWIVKISFFDSQFIDLETIDIL